MVMKRLLSFSICLLIATVTIAQTQQGYVKTKGRMVDGKLVPGQGLKGATVSIKGRTAVLVNSDDGAFSFPVPEAHFHLDSVSKKGYQLVDMDICPKTYKLSPNPLYIVMETPEQQLQDKLNAERKIRRNLQKQLQAKENEIEALKDENKISMEEYQKSLQQLYAEQESNEQLISDMAKRYSELDYDQLDEFYRQVSYFIESGELTKADSLLNTRGDITTQVNNIKQRGQAIIEQDEQLQKAKVVRAADIDEAARRCYSYYNAFAAQHLNDTAAYFLDLRASMDTANIGWLMDAGVFFMDYLANYDKALSLLNTALRQAMFQEENGIDYLVDIYNDIGMVYFYKAEYKKALDFLQNALEIGKNSLGKDHGKVVLALQNIGQVHFKLGEYKSALDCFSEALNMTEKHYGKEDSQLASIYNDIGLIYYKQGNVDKALEYYEKALETQEKTVGLDHNEVAATYNNFGLAYSYKGDHENALKYYHKALEILENIYGDLYPKTANTYGNIGLEYCCLGNYEKALEYYHINLERSKMILGEMHPQLATSYFNKGWVYYLQGEYEQAMDYYNRALVIREETLGKEHPDAAKTYNNIGKLYFDQENYDKAMECYQKALAIHEKAFGKDSPNLASSYDNIGMV